MAKAKDTRKNHGRSKFYNYVIDAKNIEKSELEEYLTATGFASVMILHDKDEGVDPHWQIMTYVDEGVGIKSFRSAINYRLKPAKMTIKDLEPTYNPRGFYQYLTHDTLEAKADGKYKYSKEELIRINEFDVDVVAPVNSSLQGANVDWLIRFIDENNICSQKELLFYQAYYGSYKGVIIPNPHELRLMIANPNCKQISVIQTFVDNRMKSNYFYLQENESLRDKHRSKVRQLARIYKAKNRNTEKSLCVDDDEFLNAKLARDYQNLVEKPRQKEQEKNDAEEWY